MNNLVYMNRSQTNHHKLKTGVKKNEKNVLALQTAGKVQ